MSIKRILSSVALLYMAAVIMAKPIQVQYEAKKGGFALVDNGHATTLVVDSGEEEVVRTAAGLFREDVQLIGDVLPKMADTPVSGKRNLIVGTLGRSAAIDALASKGEIKNAQVKGKWETFGITVVDANTLAVFGSDARGTAYGLMELSRMMGVSPWYWWADVTPRKHSTVYVQRGESFYGPPSVKFRGIFINDEDWGLQPWAAKHLDKQVNDIGPRTYEKVFELMLRMKANILWPAMHPSTKAFWYYKENPKLAKKYGMVLGSSHCEQMGRNNVDEWVHNFPFEYGRLPGPYSWKENSETVKMYWNDRVKESRDQDMVYTLGMRGIHDSGLPGYGSDEERRDVLKSIIGEQRKMLKANTGKAANEVPQMFCPYKEAMRLYRLGLDLPEDVTLMWVDDNFGYIRQLSNPEEQKRSGGAGVYYHFSYWGVPQDFLWLGATPPALMAYEMSKAYAMNCRDLWVFNVGDIKPIEYEAQYALDFAWDISTLDITNADLYGKLWGAELFGSDVAEDIYRIKRDYGLLSQGGKPEHVNFVDYSVEEMLARLEAYGKLVAEVDALQERIPSSLQDAYYELIAYPVKACAAMNEKVFGQKLSRIYAENGHRNGALNYAALCKDGFAKIEALTEQYNKRTAGGKWDGMMNYAPRGLRHFKAFEPAQEKDIAAVEKPLPKESVYAVKADQYVRAKGKNVRKLHGLGVTGESVAVWPLDMTTYETGTIGKAPYVEYRLPVKQGKNTLRVKCLPTFPVYSGMKLRYAISVDGSEPQFVSIHAEAETKQWSPNVLRGYTFGDTEYDSPSAHDVTVRIYFADPGVVLNGVELRY